MTNLKLLYKLKISIASKAEIRIEFSHTLNHGVNILEIKSLNFNIYSRFRINVKL